MVGFIVWRSVKSKSDLGENFVNYFQGQELFWLAIVVFILMIGEAGFVATFHPKDELDYIPFGPRFIGHLGINLAGYIATINAPKKWYELFAILPPIFGSTEAKKAHAAKIKAAGINTTKVVMLLIYAVFSTGISLSLPVINIIILANGLEQMEQFRLFVQDIFRPMADYYAQLPREYLGASSRLPLDLEYAGRNYSPFEDMRYPLQIVIAMVFVHYPLAFMKGMAGMLVKSKSVMFRDQKEKEEKKPKGEDKDDIVLMSGVKKLLKFYGYSGGELSTKIDQINTKLATMAPSLQATLSSNCAAMVDKLTKAQNKGMDSTKILQYKNDIKSFFGRPTSSGTGFGITLSPGMLVDDDDDQD